MKFRILALALLAVTACTALASESAEEMLGKINSIKNPVIDRTKTGDKEYIAQYYAGVDKANEERNVLILDFYKAYPENDDAGKLMVRRWSTMGGSRTRPNKATLDKIITDIDSVLSAKPASSLKLEGSFLKARYQVMEPGQDVKAVGTAVDGFIKAYPADPRGAQLLSMEAQLPSVKADDAALRAVYMRMINEYKDSPSSKYAPGIIRRMDAIGKPFDLSFTDAVSGKKISTKDLKGKVVLLDFWATWCGPCIARMPEMKKMYADMHDKGLEVLGISLDQPEGKGGLTKLKDYVAKNEIAWPQYYQGNYWQSEFSASWGINSIPCVFLIDKNGNLSEITYPADLPTKVQKLLDK